MNEELQKAINTISLWEAARSLKKAKILPNNFIEENRTSFFTPEQNELIDNYTNQKSIAVGTVIKTFKKFGRIPT